MSDRTIKVTYLNQEVEVPVKELEGVPSLAGIVAMAKMDVLRGNCRRLSEVPLGKVQWDSPMVNVIKFNGDVRQTHNTKMKEEFLALAAADESILLLLAWPGAEKQDVLWIDDPAAALKDFHAWCGRP